MKLAILIALAAFSASAHAASAPETPRASYQSRSLQSVLKATQADEGNACVELGDANCTPDGDVPCCAGTCERFITYYLCVN